MTPQCRELIEKFEVRKTKQQKAAFRDWLCRVLEDAGCRPVVETSGMSNNVVVGDPETAKVIFSAHYDTQAVLPIPNFITPRNIGWYVLYQLALALPMVLAIIAVELVVITLTEGLLGPASAFAGMIAAYAVLILFIWLMLAGPANKHTMNDNTSGVLTLLESILAMPPEDREKVCFVFFDNEELGMLGSSAFTKAHKEVKRNTLNINFDCVSDGDSIQFFPGKQAKKDPEAIAFIEKHFTAQGNKTTEVVRGFGFYPSDNAVFKKGVGVCALHYKKPFGWYMSRIHTKRDTVMEEENIVLLREGVLRMAADRTA